MRLAAFALLLTLSLAACGGKDDAPAASADNAAAADAGIAAAEAAAAEDAPAELPPLPTGDFRIVSVTLGKAVDEEGLVGTPLEVFGTGDAIHAAVVAVGSSQGLTISARWTAADGTEVGKAGQAIAPSAPTVASFSIRQPEPWPVGAYQVEILVNDRVLESRAFRIE